MKEKEGEDYSSNYYRNHHGHYNHHNRNNNENFHDHCYCHHHSPVSVIYRKTIGFLVFIILLSTAAMISRNINNPVYTDVVLFFSSNISLFLVLFLIGMINDIFWNFYFPANIIAPVISSVLSIFVVSFLYQIWLFIDTYVNTRAVIPISAIYMAVFILTLILGYVRIFTREARKRFRERREEDRKIKRGTWKRTDWDDVGEQFRLAFYNFGSAMRNAFEKHENKETKKTKRNSNKRSGKRKKR